MGSRCAAPGISNLTGVELEPFLRPPDALLMPDVNLPHDFGLIPKEARATRQHYIAKTLDDPKSKLVQVAYSTLAGPTVPQGAE